MWIPSEAVNIIFIFKITYSNYYIKVYKYFTYVFFWEQESS